MKWISIKDEKPKAGENVLVHNGEIVGVAMMWDYGTQDEKTKKWTHEMDWRYPDFIDSEHTGVCWLDIKNITHWAEMPKIKK